MLHLHRRRQHGRRGARRGWAGQRRQRLAALDVRQRQLDRFLTGVLDVEQSDVALRVVSQVARVLDRRVVRVDRVRHVEDDGLPDVLLE
jgi:hypothetical protein